MGSAGCHRRSTLSVALRQTFATLLSWLQERYSECFVGTHKMIVGAPPLQMGEQVRGLLSRGPGSASQRGYPLADGQIHALNKGGVQPTRKT